MSEQKNNLLLGIMTGIAIISTAGFLIMTAAYFQKSQNIAESSKTKDANNSARNNNGNAPANAAIIKSSVSGKDQVRGNEKAPVTIIEYSDIQCPFCTRFHNTMKQVMANYDGKVKWIFRHFPLGFHTMARKSAIAAECAGEQNKFWEYTDYLYENQGSLSDSFLNDAAKTVGLDTAKFSKCVVEERYASKVDDDTAAGRAAGITGTPGSIINGQLVKGALPYEDIKKIIDQNLSK